MTSNRETRKSAASYSVATWKPLFLVIWKPLFLVISICLTHAVTVLADTPPRPDNRLVRLQRLSESQKNEIQTARLEAFFFHYTRNLPDSKLTAAQTDACLELLSQAVAKEASLARLTEIILSLGLPKEYKWDTLKIVKFGSSVSNILSRLTESGLEEPAIHGAYTQGVGLTKFDQNQISIFRGPGQYFYTPNAMRHVPQLEGRAFRIDSTRGGFLRLSADEGADKLELVAFEDQGLLKSSDRRNTKDHTFHALRQFEPAGFPGGVIFPRLSSRYSGTGKIVTDLEVAIIRQAEFNVPIDTTEFRIPFQEGTVFADHRADRDQFAPATKTWKASVGGDDALDAADHPQNTARWTPEHRSRAPWRGNDGAGSSQ
jgi:hypothetical protein